MNRRRFLGVAGALGAAAVTGACGIPGSSEPRFLESGRPVEPPRDAPAEPPIPSVASSPSDLVANYLMAAAGANYATGGATQDAMARAQERARAYLTSAAQSQWQPDKKSLMVVRAAIGAPTQSGGGVVDVSVGLTVVGEFNGVGAIEYSDNKINPFTFRVVNTGSGYLLETAPPPFLLLSDEGLKRFYNPQTIYFWDASEQPMLVPDQRYLLRSIGRANEPNEIVGWLTTTAAPAWLRPALGVQPLDNNIEVKDVSLNDQQRLVVNLSAKAANIDKHRLAVQLRWSTLAIGGVDVRIEGASTGVSSDDYQNFNASATRADNNGEPERFCVVDRKARPVESSNATAILVSEANVDVVAAAIAMRKRTAALVKQETNNKGKVGYRLWVGTLSGTGDASTVTYARTTLWFPTVSRPVWISRPSAQVLFAADGNLYSAPPPAPGNTSEIPPVGPLQPNNLPGPITALSVSPDGRRIAFIAGGKVVVAPLKLDNPVTVGELSRPIQTDLAVQKAVAWSAETKLLVGGAPIKDKNALFEITINGAGQEPVPPEGTGNYTIDVLSVRPASPTGSPQLAMLDANSTAYRVYAAEIQPLKLGGPSPAPSPSASTSPVEQHLTAPFFLD